MDELEVSLVLHTTAPLTWAVEASNVEGDGSIEIARFSGPSAERRAREYSAWKYGVGRPLVVAD